VLGYLEQINKLSVQILFLVSSNFGSVHKEFEGINFGSVHKEFEGINFGSIHTEFSIKIWVCP